MRLCRDLAVRVAPLLRVVSEYLAGLTKSNLEPFTGLFFGQTSLVFGFPQGERTIGGVVMCCVLFRGISTNPGTPSDQTRTCP